MTAIVHRVIMHVRVCQYINQIMEKITVICIGFLWLLNTLLSNRKEIVVQQMHLAFVCIYAIYHLFSQIFIKFFQPHQLHVVLLNVQRYLPQHLYFKMDIVEKHFVLSIDAQFRSDLTKIRKYPQWASNFPRLFKNHSSGICITERDHTKLSLFLNNLPSSNILMRCKRNEFHLKNFALPFNVSCTEQILA